MTTNRRKFTWLLNGLLITAFAAALFVSASTHAEPEGHWWGVDQVDRASQPKNIPTWDEYARPGFRDIAAKPADAIPSRLLVVLNDGSTAGLSLDEAFARNQDDNTANDVWVVGARWAA